jgi:hypothetical protein
MRVRGGDWSDMRESAEMQALKRQQAKHREEQRWDYNAQVKEGGRGAGADAGAGATPGRATPAHPAPARGSP